MIPTNSRDNSHNNVSIFLNGKSKPKEQACNVSNVHVLVMTYCR